MSKSDEAKKVPVKEGDRVTHEIFGVGLVEKVTMSCNGHDYHVHVAFDEERKSRPTESNPSRYRKILLSYLVVTDTPTTSPLDENASEVNGSKA